MILNKGCMILLLGLGLRIWDSGFRIQGLKLENPDSQVMNMIEELYDSITFQDSGFRI